jgi:F-type H+-transporting ATPase subunit gamma
VLVVIIASDRGLAGSFNSALFSHVERFLLSSSTPKDRYACIAVGIKAAEFIKRSGLSLVQDFSKFADAATVEDIAPIAKLIETQFLTGAFGRVICFSTTFLSALSQKPVLHELLPLSFDTIRHAVEEILPVTGKYSQLRTNLIEHRPEKPPEYLIEPSRQSVIAEISSLLFDTYFYHIVLEANASEHSARRAAMKNAADNASELIDTLTLAYNRLRQASITREIIEITGTAGAMQ